MGTPARPAASAYVISPEEIKPGWVLLYAISCGLQIVAVFIRFSTIFVVLSLTLDILGRSRGSVPVVSQIVAWAPLVISFATLVLPLGGWFWRQQAGGRAPSERERLIYEDALAVLALADTDLRPPRRWFVLDEPMLNAAAYADTLMITRGLLDSGHLDAVLAHELGHLNSSDSRLAAALRRLTTPPRRRLHFPLATLGFLFSGGFGVWLTRRPWAAYWRAREFAADEYAAKLGQGPALARFLDAHALENDLPVPFMWLTPESHPYSEHRIERLSRASR